MPELPEVDRAAALLRSVACGKTVHRVESWPDPLVYAGLTHREFAAEVAGRTIRDAARYGKHLYIQLDGEGRMPVLHFGMTATLSVQGSPAPRYMSTQAGSSDGWPPRFVKFILFVQEHDSGFTQLAFCDARRLGRIRMAFSPFMAVKRSCTIKALLLDQSFSAGVGNYLADEILYQARVHPEQRSNTLDDSQTLALHHQIADVCRIAVEANADDTKYPDHWLFHHRWGKGKKASRTMRLLSGESATIRWITVGGRTSAYIPEVQKLPTKQKRCDPPPEEANVGSTSNIGPRRSKRRRYAQELPMGLGV